MIGPMNSELRRLITAIAAAGAVGLSAGALLGHDVWPPDTNTVSSVTNKTLSFLSNTFQNTVAEYDATGDGATTTFTLTGQNLLAGNHALVYVDGRLQRSGSGNAYTTTTGTTNQLTFTVAPDNNSWIHVVVVNQQ